MKNNKLKYIDLYETLKPFMKKEIPFDSFVMYIKIIESVKTSEYADKIAQLLYRKPTQEQKDFQKSELYQCLNKIYKT